MWHELKDEIHNIFVKLTLGNNEILGLVYTAATRNVMSEDLVKKLNLHISNDKQVHLRIANNEIITLQETPEIDFKLNRITTRKF